MGSGAKPALKPGNERQPPTDRLVPITYRPPNSIIHRISDGERWESVAALYSVGVKELIWENFKTGVPAEINWYLNHYVSCDTPTPDGYNWRFTTSARQGPSPRAGIVFIPQRVAQQPPVTGGDPLKDLEEIRNTLKEIQDSIRTGQEAMHEVLCAVTAEAFARRGLTTDQSLQYLSRDELNLLLTFIECMILSSRRISPFVRGHPNASHSNPASPMGDLARLRIHPDYHYKDALAKEGIQVDKNTRGLFDPGSRSIHLPETATFGQALHEGVHSFSSAARETPVFLGVFGSFLYEGVTQLFTDMVLDDRKWKPATRHDYKKELGCARRLHADFGMAMVANAYFRRDAVPLANAITRRLNINHFELRRLSRLQDDANLRRGHVLCERLGYL